MADVFNMYSAYYDLLYRDKDYGAEVRHIQRLIRRHCPGAAAILELGSGTGRHARLLAECGYRVHGLERSATMLEQARQLAADSPARDRLSFLQQDIRDLGAEGRYDVVTSLFHVVSYLTDTEDVRRVFAAVARNLAPQGIFLFDCWHGPAVLRQAPEVRVKRVENEACRLIRIAEPELRVRDNTVAVNYDMFIEPKPEGAIAHFTERHLMRYFFEPELAVLLAEAGLKVVACEADLGLEQPPSERHWGLTVIAQPVTSGA